MEQNLSDKIKNLLFTVFGAIVVLIIAITLLKSSAIISKGIRTGIGICTNIIIPSLFPFMALSGFIAISPIGDTIAKPLSPITKYMFRLPPQMGTVILMSFIGGYPIGARLISSLLEQDRIDDATARRMLCFCVNAGPSFIISAVGVSLYSSVRIGLLLLAAHMLSSLLIGVILSIGAPQKAVLLRPKKYISPSAALVQGVASSANGLIIICAFVILFSGLSAYLTESGLLYELSTFFTKKLFALGFGSTFYNALIIGMLEVTNGCVAAASLGGEASFVLTAFLLSFGGLSVICQVISCFNSSHISFCTLLLSRLLGGFLSAAIARPLYLHYCGDITVLANTARPIMVATPRSVAVALCIIGMCAIVMLSASVNVSSSHSAE